jgi:hypothetical protein
MKINNASPQVMNFLERLKRDGDLIDVYSENFFGKQPNISDDPYAPFSKETLEEIEYLEGEAEEDKKPKNHLLFMFINEYKEDVLNEIQKIFPPLRKFFAAWHKPDFLLINLYTQQILCVGFGRKNKLFIIDAHTEKIINFFGSRSYEVNEYILRFTEHDINEAINDFLSALNDLSFLMFENDSLPGSEDEISIAIDAGPSEDGFYYIKGVDDEKYTKDELTQLLSKYEDLQTGEDKAMKMINIFFPQCERGELNTGDY